LRVGLLESNNKMALNQAFVRFKDALRGGRQSRPPAPRGTKPYLVYFGEAFRETGLAIDQVGLQMMDNFASKDNLNRHRRIMTFHGKTPTVKQGTWVAPNASLIGQVNVGTHTSVWYGATVRGDLHPITVGNLSAIGERAVIRSANGETKIGDGVLVGDGAVLHSCTLESDSIVEANAVVLEGATVGTSSVVGPSSVVQAGSHIPNGEYWAGNPAKFVRKIEQSDLKSLHERVDHQHQMAIQHDNELAKDAKQINDDLEAYEGGQERLKHSQIKYDY